MDFKGKAEKYLSQLHVEEKELYGARMESADIIVLAGDRIKLDDVSTKKLATFLGFPHKTLEKASESLIMMTFNHFLKENEEKSVFVQYFDGQADNFYRVDRELFPIEKVLTGMLELESSSGISLSRFVTDDWVENQGTLSFDILDDLLSAGNTRFFQNKEYYLYRGVRVNISLDPRKNSSVKTFIDFVPDIHSGEDVSFTACLSDKSDKGEVSSKNLTISGLANTFIQEVKDSLDYADEVINNLLPGITDVADSHFLPKIETMVQESFSTMTPQKRIVQNIVKDNPVFAESGVISEWEAFKILGKQSASSIKSRGKLEDYLGHMIKRQGQTVTQCKCCGNIEKEYGLEEE